MTNRNPPPRAFKDFNEARNHLDDHLGYDFRMLSWKTQDEEGRRLHHVRRLLLNDPTHRWFANVQEVWEHQNPGCSWDVFKYECATDPFTKWWTPPDSKLPHVFYMFGERIGSPPRFSLATRTMFTWTSLLGVAFLGCSLVSCPPSFCLLAVPGLVVWTGFECEKPQDHNPSPNAYLYTPSYKKANKLWTYHASPKA